MLIIIIIYCINIKIHCKYNHFPKYINQKIVLTIKAHISALFYYISTIVRSFSAFLMESSKLKDGVIMSLFQAIKSQNYAIVLDVTKGRNLPQLE